MFFELILNEITESRVLEITTIKSVIINIFAARVNLNLIFAIENPLKN